MAKKELVVEVAEESIQITPAGRITGNTSGISAGIVIILLLAGIYFFKRK